MSKFQVFLPHHDQHGVKFHRSKKVWTVTWTEARPDGSDPKIVYEVVEAKTKEEAKKERNRIYTRLLLAGAKYHNDIKPVPKKRIRKVSEAVGEDDYLRPKWIKLKRWQVVIEGKVVSTHEDKEDARKARDRHLREMRMRPCKVCGKRPVWVRKGKHGRKDLVHREDGCPNQIEIKSNYFSVQDKIDLWNDRVYNGKFGHTGVLTPRMFGYVIEDPRYAFKVRELNQRAKEIEDFEV